MVLGTLYSMFLTVTVAYPLSFDSKNFRGRKIYVAFFFISMLFSGGIIPYYILIRNLNLMDTIWALVLGPVPVGSVIILMNFYRQLPKALFESARIDGASHFRILAKIYLPLSMPSIATLSLMSLVGHWNEWFGGMIYMKDVANYPLQTYLYASMQNVSEFVSLARGRGLGFEAGADRRSDDIHHSPHSLRFPRVAKIYKNGAGARLGQRITLRKPEKPSLFYNLIG